MVVDRIGDIYRNLSRRADVIVTTVGARHKCQQGSGFEHPMNDDICIVVVFVLIVSRICILCSSAASPGGGSGSPTPRATSGVHRRPAAAQHRRTRGATLRAVASTIALRRPGDVRDLRAKRRSTSRDDVVGPSAHGRSPPAHHRAAVRGVAARGRPPSATSAQAKRVRMCTRRGGGAPPCAAAPWLVCNAIFFGPGPTDEHSVHLHHRDFIITPIADQIGPIDSVSKTEQYDLKNRFSEPQCKMTVLPLNSGKPRTCVALNGSGIQLAVGPQPLRLRNHNSGLAHRIMVKRLATSPHDPLGITDSACKNQLVVVSVQYGPFYPYIPIRSTTIGKSRVAKDPIAMHTSWRSNSDIASVTSSKRRLPPLTKPPPPPPPFAGNCSGQLDEENPSALISSGLLVQADERVSYPVMDLIDVVYRHLP
ncbi:hypothetical protein F511_25672 [Dorcoceras hygrometricum]|uniref:Uncharacterized protein n=1 Tax=Dorcoceras hygrometricum TaxID=472368 RepID=A0A2Z7DBC0_9LAMI|nr:hypothetical protein F511_25672 [Dorcoceras hygrometricum]